MTTSNIPQTHDETSKYSSNKLIFY